MSRSFVTGRAYHSLPRPQDAGFYAKLNREELKELCQDTNYSDIECMGAIMAWGGMRRNNARILFLGWTR